VISFFSFASISFGSTARQAETSKNAASTIRVPQAKTARRPVLGNESRTRPERAASASLVHAQIVEFTKAQDRDRIARAIVVDHLGADPA
jgi:hypothetical protein